LWSHPDRRRTIKTVIDEVLQTAPVCGFAWFELTARPVMWQLPGDIKPRRYWVPDVPHWRAPWSVSEWILQSEQLVGVQAEYYGAGSANKGRVILPASNIVHVAADSVESDLEGTSFIRAAHPYLEMLRKALETWGLAVEVNGLGTLVVTIPDNLDDKDAEKLYNHCETYRSAHVPHIQKPEGVEIEVISPQSQLPDLTPHINALERMAMLAMKSSHTLIALQKAGGSFAARSDASADARAGLAYIAQTLVSPVINQALGRFLRWNFPHDNIAERIYHPVLSYGQMAQKDVAAFVTSVAQAKQAGLLDDPEIGGFIREELGLPQASSAEQHAPHPAMAGKLLKPADVAARTGFTRATVSNWCRLGKVRSVRVQGQYRIPESELPNMIG
ncbi:MAG: helix-turn-helix domain-containing protein, partial [Nannocystaceae bacterium]